MSKERVCANEEARPVTTWENHSAKGHALCAEFIFREHIEKTQALRDRQAKYLKSLPSDPKEAISAALNHMAFDYSDYPEGIEEARHLSTALLEMLRFSRESDFGWNLDTAVYLADRIELSMQSAVKALDRIKDTLREPGRSGE